MRRARLPSHRRAPHSGARLRLRTHLQPQASPMTRHACRTLGRPLLPALVAVALGGGAAAGIAHVVYIRQLPKGDYNDVGYVLVPGSMFLGASLATGVGYV